MNLLIATALVSFIGAVYTLVRKVNQVASHPEAASVNAHTNFVFDFCWSLTDRAKEHLEKVYSDIRPLADNFIATATSSVYKISAWFAHETLKLHNFIQGRRVLRGYDNSSDLDKPL